MNIAVLLTGRIYTADYEITLRRLKHIFNDHNVTYFISINDTDLDKMFLSLFIRDTNISHECIHVQQCQLPSHVYAFKKKEETSYFNTYSMFYHNKICFTLVEKYTKKYNICFDVVLKFRTDINPNESITFSNPVEQNTLYIPIGYNYGGVNDQIAYGNINAMFVYCSCVDEIENICHAGTLFHPETILNIFLTKHKLQICRFPFVYTLKY